MLLGQLDGGPPDRRAVAVQLTAALEGPILLYRAAHWSAVPPQAGPSLVDGWRFLVERALGPR